MSGEKVCKPRNPTFPGRGWECSEKEEKKDAAMRMYPPMPGSRGPGDTSVVDGPLPPVGPMDAPRLPEAGPPPRMPDAVETDKSGPVGGIVATVLAAGKNAVMFVVTHPATPYAVGAAAVAGAFYFGYRWFRSEAGESDAACQQNDTDQNRDDAQEAVPKNKNV